MPSSRLQLFLARPSSDRLLFAEALARLLLAKVRIHTRPFRWIAPGLGRAQAETPVTLASSERAVAVKVSWAVETAARYVPLGFVCLPQAIAAQRMLRRRGLPSTLYLGVREGGGADQSFAAHAWLRAGDKIVTGAAAMPAHRAIASFADEPPAR